MDYKSKTIHEFHLQSFNPVMSKSFKKVSLCRFLLCSGEIISSKSYYFLHQSTFDLTSLVGYLFIENK